MGINFVSMGINFVLSFCSVIWEYTLGISMGVFPPVLYGSLMEIDLSVAYIPFGRFPLGILIRLAYPDIQYDQSTIWCV